MRFAVEAHGALTDIQLESLQQMAANVEWEMPPGRYHTADVSDRFTTYKRAFFLRLPPGTGIHKHRDCGDVQTDHIVVATNPKCLNWWVDEDRAVDQSMHMELGKRYTVDRTCLHWARNDGETDRIHLLLEY